MSQPTYACPLEMARLITPQRTPPLKSCSNLKLLQIQADGPAGAGQNPLGLFFSVVVVDARDNKPRTAGSPNTAALPAASRGKKRLGGLALANSSVADNKKKVRASVAEPRLESTKSWAASASKSMDESRH